MSHKCYDVTFKLRAVAVAEAKSKEAAAREFKVDARRIREWCSQKEKPTALKKNGKTRSKRLKGSWTKARTWKKNCLTGSWI